jgi:hypothetical protein
MTRSFTALVGGDISLSLAEHPFGPILFVGFAVTGLHFGLEALSGRRLNRQVQQWMAKLRVIGLAGVAYLIAYGWRLIHLLMSHQLANDFFHAPLGRWWLAQFGGA